MDGTPHRFRLERIRSLRERSEEQAKHVLAEATMRQRTAEEEMRGAAERMIAARATLATPLSGVNSATDMLNRHGYLERMEGLYSQARRSVEQRAAETDARRVQLVEASRERKSLDRLAERSLAKHQLEAGRRESAALDEMALNSHRRKVGTA